MIPRDETERLNRVLEGRALPQSDVERLAIRVIATPPHPSMPVNLRGQSWERILAAAPPATSSPISQQPAPHRHIDNRRHGFLPASLPAPGVVLFAVVLSLVVAFGGSVDDPGRTSSVAASTTASPMSWAPVATPMPTPAAAEDAIDV